VPLMLMITGCPSSHETVKEKPVSRAPRMAAGPETIIKVASLNLAKYSRRIEADDVDRFASILRRDTIDILALEGITRYPDLVSRVDVVDELALRAELRTAFGETITISGRQGGNAVLSAYPIVSNQNTHYTGLHANDFEAALQAVVDCGTAQVVVVSTGIPENAAIQDQSAVALTLNSLRNLYVNNPMIISGNLPRADALRDISTYDDATPAKMDDTPRVWYSIGGAIKPIRVRSERTNFGPMVVALFGLYRQPGP